MSEKGPLQFIDAIFCQISVSKNIFAWKNNFTVNFQTF